MIINLTKKWQLKVYFNRQEKRTGICSQQFNNPDKHCLLWDFDNIDLNTIIHSLRYLQVNYDLPDVWIIQSSPERYHAYCFTARPFREIIHILSATPEIDMAYLRLGIVRGYYTLRITPRKDSPEFKLVKVLVSTYKNEMTPLDATINEYWTSNKGLFGK
jgi:hypothetical protein